MPLTDAQKAYGQIKEMIVTTAMRPGSVIRESDLMAALGLGRTPIREALKLLEAEKLVIVSPRRGMFVADVVITDLLHIEEVRLELEALCVRLAIQRMSEAQVDQLRRLVDELERCRGVYSSEELLELDRRFHQLLMEASHNRLLQAECEMLFNLSLRIWYLFIDNLGPHALAEEAFREILAAAENRDPARAERAIRTHILNFGESIKKHLYPTPKEGKTQ